MDGRIALLDNQSIGVTSLKPIMEDVLKAKYIIGFISSHPMNVKKKCPWSQLLYCKNDLKANHTTGGLTRTNQNTHSINCTPVTTVTVTAAVTAAVPELLHGPILSPLTSQIKFSPISRGGINWSVCRSNSLGTLHSTH